MTLGLFLTALGLGLRHGIDWDHIAAIADLTGTTIPESFDAWMGRAVGVTLVALGGWIIIELARKGRAFRLRSRWMLIIEGTFAGFRKVRGVASRRSVADEHELLLPTTAPRRAIWKRHRSGNWNAARGRRREPDPDRHMKSLESIPSTSGVLL